MAAPHPRINVTGAPFPSPTRPNPSQIRSGPTVKLVLETSKEAEKKMARDAARLKKMQDAKVRAFGPRLSVFTATWRQFLGILSRRFYHTARQCDLFLCFFLLRPGVVGLGHWGARGRAFFYSARAGF